MNSLKKITIVGGGTAGWIAAAVLCNQFSPEELAVELVESEAIGTIGVGESTIPPFLELLHSLNIDEKDFIQKTQASFKLGIEFSDWKQRGESYFHPFGSISANMDEYVFYQNWLKSCSKGDGFALQDFSACSVMAKHQKFFLPQGASKTPVSEARYALHLDANLVARYLREYSEQRGVKRTEGKVVRVHQKDCSHIRAVQLQDGREIAGDFFIDCSGFRGLLIEQTLQAGYEDWSHFLPCDRAIAIQTENVSAPPPYTRATAQPAGWSWKIPLQYRTGNGYVYASEYCSDDEAIDTLMAQLEGRPLTDPRVIPFQTGMRREIWKGNCLALGLASGFIEPLESTAIHLIARGMVHFMRHFPERDCQPVLAQEFNRRMAMDYEEIRDFIVLHYCLTQREDTAFWRWCKNMTLPDSLRQTLDYFQAQGGLPESLDPLFAPVSWRSVCEGMGLRPASYSPLINSFDYNTTRAHLLNYRQALEDFIQQLPDHQSFILKNCPSEKPMAA
ncbi:tryptophan halogenase family protein [Microbulbifer sp. ALW1]|uniref:tryptophan halogenase family protein n=1 Tax=Microbulbifer sp. (strain ALW1) TaxID=1516059 RepID=UPI001358CE2B|nr:tryptophan halogenase family protein [Microbulbifer sp. ALW1]